MPKKYSSLETGLTHKALLPLPPNHQIIPELLRLGPNLYWGLDVQPSSSSQKSMKIPKGEKETIQLVRIQLELDYITYLVKNWRCEGYLSERKYSSGHEGW